jgi:hypothetical protein
MAIQCPAWLATLPESEQKVARRKFLLKVCAMYATPNGTMREFSSALGYNEGSLYTYFRGDADIPPKLAIAIENLVGVELAPRELLLPEIFSR